MMDAQDACVCGHKHIHHVEWGCSGLTWKIAHGMTSCLCEGFELPPPTLEEQVASLTERVAELERLHQPAPGEPGYPPRCPECGQLLSEPHKFVCSRRP